MCHFRAQNSPICPEQNFFATNHYYYFHLPIDPLCKIRKKNSYSESRVMRMHHFWAQNGSFTPNNYFFLKKIINIIFIYILAPSILQNLKKKFLESMQSNEDVPFSGPKYPNLSWTKFFGTSHFYYFHLPIGPFHWTKF